MKIFLNKKSLMKFGKWSFMVLMLTTLGYFFITSVLTVFADILPGQGPFTSPEGQLVPAWVNLTKGDMFFANGNQVFIVANFSCNGTSVCNGSMTTTANFSQIGGSGDVAGVFKQNATDGKSWALFEFNSTVNLTQIGGLVGIRSVNVTINATEANESATLANLIDAPVLLVNMSTFGCPPPGAPATFPAVPGWNESSNSCLAQPIQAVGVMTGGRIGLNDTEFNGSATKPNLNLTARLTIYNVSKYGITGRPQIFRYPHRSTAGSICPPGVCSDFVFDGENITFTVTSFSDYGLTDAINVTLNSPSDSGYSNLLNTNFTFMPEWNSSVTMQNCTLYGNFSGSWQGVQANQSALVNGVINGINYTVSSDGVYLWNVYCYDTTGQYDLAESNWTVTVDTTKPQWSNNQSWYPTNYNSSKSVFNISWTDSNGISTVFIEGNWSGAPNNYTMTLLTGNVYNYNETLPAGTFYWKSYSNDSANNWNVSDTWYFTVNKASPSLSIGPLTTVTYGTSTQTGCEKVTGDSSSWMLILYRNGTQVVNGTSSPINESSIVLGASTYNYTCTINETQNYTAGSLTDQYRTVNPANNILSSLACSPSSPVTYPTQTTCTGSQTTTGDSDVTYYLYRNDTGLVDNKTNANPSETILLGAGSYLYVFNSSAGQNYTANSTGLNLVLIVNQNQTNPVNLYLNGTLNSNRTYIYPEAINATGVALYSDSGTLHLYRGNEVGSGTGSVTEEILLGNNTYAYKVNITGNQNYTSNSTGITYYAFVLKGTPSLSINFNITSPIVYETPSRATASGCPTQGATDVTCYFYRNDTGSISSPDDVLLGAGSYEYVYNTTGGANWTSGETSQTLVVNKKNANVQVSPPTQTITYGASVTQYCTDNSTLLGCVLYRNGTQITNDTTEILAAGVYSYVANISDTANYTNYQATSTLTVNKASTNTTLYLNGTSADKTGDFYHYGEPANLTVELNVSQTVELWTNFTGTYGLWDNGTGSVVNYTILNYNPGLYNVSGNFSGNENYTSSFDSHILTIWGYSEINESSHASSVYTGTTTTLYCRVRDKNTTSPISGYNVTFYDNTTYLGSDLTNSSGWANVSASWSSAGVYQITCNITDDASLYYNASETNYNTSTITVSVAPTTTTTTTTIPGGGGGAPYVPPKRKSHIWSRITPGAAAIMHVDDPDIGLKQIRISVKNPANNVEITVTKLKGKPASVVHNVSGKVYKYIQIEATNLEDTNIQESKIQFPVNKSWISENGIDPSTVALNRYKNDEWKKLPTTKISEDSDYIYYEAKTPGFSIFAVTGEKAKVTTTTTPTTIATTSVATTTIPTTTVPAAPKISKLVWIVIGIIIICIVAFILWKYLKPSKTKSFTKP